MCGVLVATGIGLAIDPRTIGGDPAWLCRRSLRRPPPSGSLTLAWLLSFVPDWPARGGWSVV